MIIIGPQACPRRLCVLRFGVASGPAWAVSTPSGTSSLPSLHLPLPHLPFAQSTSPLIFAATTASSRYVLYHSPFVRSSLVSHPSHYFSPSIFLSPLCPSFFYTSFLYLFALSAPPLLLLSLITISPSPPDRLCPALCPASRLSCRPTLQRVCPFH